MLGERNVDNTWNNEMKVIVFLALALTAFAAVESSHLSWSGIHSPNYQSYEAKKAHDLAKYHARKAHDIAKLQSKIFGIGYGLYGFRYGSHYPHFSKPFPLLPYIDKYPLFDFGISPYPFSHFFPHKFDPIFDDSLSLSSPLSYSSSPLLGYDLQYYDKPYFISGISNPLTGFGYPKAYRNSYSKSYSYGSGYSHGKKESYGLSLPHIYGYSGLHAPSPPRVGYVKSLPGGMVAYQSDGGPHSHSYQYAFVKETPGYPKISPPLKGGYNSIYGTRVSSYGQNSEGLPKQIIAYNPANSANYQLEPVGNILVTGQHGGHSYINDGISGYDLDDQFDGYSGHSLPLQSDLIAYGSEKSFVEEKKSN